mmetsp:Transcript_44904/g.88840  ORF Transcript_44904/g.88840 Transcript_44904/m.88840 type:complete len:237 (-) Transcript_44904:189-899(-)
MVIPIPGGMPQLSGPPPPELSGRFQFLKYCVLALMAALLLHILVGLLTDILSAIRSSLTLIFLVITGIFLMNDDDQLRPAYNCMMSTCFQPCHDQCPGGMSCLISFGALCLVSVVIDLIMGQLQSIFTNSVALFGGKLNFLRAALFFSMLISLLARSFGAYFSWKAYQDYRDMATLPGGGGGNDWANDQQPQSGGGGRMWGGGTIGGGGGGGGGGQPPPSQEFQAFQGSGQRLGGE